jgi:hypothetical protein
VSESAKRARAPVKVHYKGYYEDWDEWVSGDRLRSKALGVQRDTGKPRTEAFFNYPRRDPSGAHPKTNKTGDDDPDKDTMVTDAVKKPVYDARKLARKAKLSKEGFQLESQTTEVDFDDPDSITKTYYSEMEELVKKHTGAERCILFDHTVRKVSQANSAKGFGTAAVGGSVTMAVNKVHGDYTDAGAPRRVLLLSKTSQGTSFTTPPLTEQEAEAIASGGHRFQIVNVWRNISKEAPVKRMPLAVLDCTTVKDDDLFVVDLVFKDRVGENLAIDQTPRHRWYYYPEMKREEVLLFKTFDSAEQKGLARFCIHSAFDDPLTAAADPTRESCEVRVLAIHGPDKSATQRVRTVSEAACPTTCGRHA